MSLDNEGCRGNARRRAIRRANCRADRGGVTMIEMLVVLAILALLIGLLLPALQVAREAARRVRCQNHLKQQGCAISNYADLLGSYPPGWNTLGHGWTALILPYLEQNELFDEIRFQEDGDGNWDSGRGNTLVIRKVVPTYRCPSMPVPEHVNSIGVRDRVPGSYRGNAGADATSDDRSTLQVPGTRSLEDLHLNGVFFACSQVRPADLLDGLSNTLTVCESRTDPDFLKDGQSMDFWYIGSPQIDDCRCDGGNGGTEFSEFVGSTYARLNAVKHEPALPGVIMELSFGSFHADGAYALRADGSVTFLGDEIELRVLQSLSTRAGGETSS